MSQVNINFKTDFSIMEQCETGYSVPFRFLYYTNSPSRPFVASYDGTTFTNCTLSDDGLTLTVAFDDHGLGLGTLMVERRYYLTDENYASGICDEVISPEAVVAVDDNGNEYYLVLSLQGVANIETTTVVPAYYQQGPQGPQGEQGEQGAQGEQGLSAYEVAVENGYVGTETEWLESLKGDDGSLLFPNLSFDPEDGYLTIASDEDITENFSFVNGELLIEI